ncbi:3-(cis-5,6-dihydroxycyclohexa-1,3-dien-1-yl)propanoate dehydrogenase [Advenella sp. WQ 585]|uniref:3-(Cis-5,6-dihydroxycyclohexa-1, 3-dien-1-yl)propanoate dehydrogenase n=2 Tax=Advenella TaxID=290425 RepID=A0ABS6NMG7_9BURK|nr:MULTISPECIES: 3-phenylpropionate-dihydrodiol/cinnamic acid-dihydrodiol dehydrogenase [Advenella]MBK1780158.1 3-(cis-5,6-dihydroxycyclohexa-1,3-dien-1-yl)propanoate dehydrogenase [Advenella mandrilli]MBV4396798.1 3-(cis-5,6-dihydroxycyclohexa-1,3-dien-1-yl)propanoate dehydrogenase [Advenella alkanexedens]
MSWLQDQTVLITGGGSGLGLALVERFLNEGANIGVLQRSASKVELLKERYGNDIVVVQGDVANYEDNQLAVQETVKKFGKLDCFIGNAAVWDHGASLMSLSAEQLDTGFNELFSINVKGYLLGAKAASQELIKSEGSIIFSLSNSAFYPEGGGPLYTSSKHAAVGLIRQLAFELAPKVRVNGVGPCGMASDLRGPASLGQDQLRIMDSRTPEAIASILPLQFFPDASEFTGPFVLLASRENNRTLSGVMINADAGLGIRGIRNTAGGMNL